MPSNPTACAFYDAAFAVFLVSEDNVAITGSHRIEESTEERRILLKIAIDQEA
jgi:hypothetical protein